MTPRWWRWARWKNRFAVLLSRVMAKTQKFSSERRTRRRWRQIGYNAASDIKPATSNRHGQPLLKTSLWRLSLHQHRAISSPHRCLPRKAKPQRLRFKGITPTRKAPEAAQSCRATQPLDPHATPPLQRMNFQGLRNLRTIVGKCLIEFPVFFRNWFDGELHFRRQLSNTESH